ncbi:MAG: hypothetical protein ACFE89_01715 [Candidatus Hodarchaeota archaeon]
MAFTVVGFDLRFLVVFFAGAFDTLGFFFEVLGLVVDLGTVFDAALRAGFLGGVFALALVVVLDLATGLSLPAVLREVFVLVVLALGFELGFDFAVLSDTISTNK